MRHTIAGTTLVTVGVAAATTLEMAQRLDAAPWAPGLALVVAIGVALLAVGVVRK